MNTAFHCVKDNKNTAPALWTDGMLRSHSEYAGLTSDLIVPTLKIDVAQQIAQILHLKFTLETRGQASAK